ncbi:thermonuclease family protein [Bartonella sp. CB175]|uniref:thermonuclease family protein n=1 Tax=Bartonella sp. CB175 TaxID=3112256 RepID=UPI00300E3C14
MNFFIESIKRVRFKLVVIFYIIGSVLWGISQYKGKIDLSALKLFNIQEILDMNLEKEKLFKIIEKQQWAKDQSSLDVQNNSLFNNAVVFNGMASVTSGVTFKLITPVAEPWRTHIVRHIHLYGVDTCAPRQKAKLNDQEWPCGAVTTAWLVTKILGKKLSCKQAIVKNGINYAQCFVQGVDLAEAGLAEGMLVVSKDSENPIPIQYLSAEETARKNKVGLWSSDFTQPLKWRRDNGSYNPFENL